MKFMLAALSSVLLLTVSTYAQDDKELIKQVYNSVALLYSQDSSGTFHMHCTATAFDKVSHGYLFATAAHCVGNDDVNHERAAEAKDIPFYVTFDEEGDKS